MRRAAIFNVVGAATLVLFLAACSNAREQLGLEKEPPDEFRVISQAPLSLPPDFQLRPPEPGAPRPQEGTPTQRARRTVFQLQESRPDTPVFATDGSRSAGEMALVERSGGDRVDPNIRQIVELETSRINTESVSFLDTLVFWRDPEIEGSVLDADAEAQRLRVNRSLNRPVNQGETPTIKRKRKALLEGIFD